MSRTDNITREQAERLALLLTDGGQFYRFLYGRAEGVSAKEYAEVLTGLNEAIGKDPVSLDEAAEIILQAYLDFHPEIGFSKGRYYLTRYRPSKEAFFGRYRKEAF